MKKHPSNRDKSLITTGFHLPYNPKNVEKAKELRNTMTQAEKKLWYQCLRTYPFRVLRQRPIHQFIVDFYCPVLKLVIEVDGDSHFTDDGMMSDKERSAMLENYGLMVMRFTNREIMQNFDDVKAKLYEITTSCKGDPPCPPC